MEPTVASGVVDALGCVGGALSFALLQRTPQTMRQAFALVAVGSMFGGFVTPWVCDLLVLWQPWLVTDHARGGIGFLAGLAGVVVAQAVIDNVRDRATATVRLVLDWILGPAPGPAPAPQPPLPQPPILP